jgi:hypothetical protein
MRLALFSIQRTGTPSAPDMSSPKLENFTIYISCAEQYSNKTPSFDTDSLNAFSGIKKYLHVFRTTSGRASFCCSVEVDYATKDLDLVCLVFGIRASHAALFSQSF